MTYKPTDAELDALRQADNGELNFVTLRQFRIIARAALAKWGSPVVAGEVASHRVMRKGLDGNWVCDGKYWSDGPPSKELVESICSDKDRWRVDVAYTTPQPTNAQAGAVPLTDEQIKDLQDDDVFFGTCRQIVRAIEAAHGIKEGGQHGDS